MSTVKFTQRALAPGGLLQPADRRRSIAAVAVVHLGLAYALLYGLSVDVRRSTQAVTRLIAVTLSPPPPMVVIEPQRHAAAQSAAPVAARDQPGGSTGPSTIRAPNPVAPIVATAPTVSPGGSAGSGTLSGGGSGGGTGGQGAGDGAGTGEGDGGADLEWLSGEIRRSDYPRAVLAAGIGGRVEFRFTVGVAGRVTACTVTRSSGNAELDATTCRLAIQRFRYRPSKDASGRPIAVVVEGDQIWSTSRDDNDRQD
ncbi:energy transducer TonB [Sphingomonas sp.]|uniref:energy transducer TonB n=1 Tax=Sphingomonas sp. TaxID=28214 RepID=UPI00286AC26C|nr:energy transducer TonB [Sphingomonas sp.]